MDKFDFGEALAYIKAGFIVSLTLNNTERRYYLNQFNNIVCVPNGKEHLAYVISDFKIDAIMSNDWILIDNDN